jgi:hypothetical protein
LIAAIREAADRLEELQSTIDNSDELHLAVIRDLAPRACKLDECHDMKHAVRVLLDFAFRAVNG